MGDGVVEELDLREEVRRLRDEQERMKREQDRLRQQADSDGQQKGDGDKSSGPEGSDSDEPKGEEGGGEQKQEAKSGGKDDQKKDEEPKKKAGSWVREHPIALIVILIVLVIAVVGGFLLMQYLNSFVSTDDAQIDGHINAVTSRIAGTVVGVYAEDNQTVRAGQTLVDIDPRDFKISVQQAQAQVLQAQAASEAQSPNVSITRTSQATNISSSSQDTTNAQAALAGAKQSYQAAVAQLRQAEANYQRAVNDEARYKLLVDKEEVSKEQYDEKLAAKLSQKAIVDAQRASADAARETIVQREAALAQAITREREAQQNAPRSVAIQRAQVASRQADIQRYKAELDQALLNLTYSRLASPVTGVVGRRSVEVGQHISAGQQLMGITNLDDLWVTANFKETQLRNLKPGQSVRIHVDAISADFDGYIESMPGASGAKYSLLPPENATGNYVKVVQRLPVRIRLKSDQSGAERLRPGMSVVPKVAVR